MEGARAQLRAHSGGEEPAEKARGSLEPEKALFVILGPLQNRMETQKLTCDLLTLRLEFNSTVFSHA